MTDFIEKKVENFRFLWGYAPEGTLKQKKGVELETVFRKGLEEALLKGLEMAEGAVPGSDENTDGTDPFNDGVIIGKRTAKSELLQTLAALKKEVMEGME